MNLLLAASSLSSSVRGKNLSRFLRPKIAVPRQAKLSKIAALSRQKSKKSRQCRGKNRKNRGFVAGNILKIAALSRQKSRL